MDGPATHRSLRLGIDAELHRPRSRLCLWRSFYQAASRHGHSGPANRATLAMAEPERLIGSIRRECLDHVVVFGERHLRHLLISHMAYYNGARTHLSLNKDAPVPRAVQAIGRILPTPILGGLHHQYLRTV